MIYDKEQMDIVDGNDIVIGTMSQAEVYAKRPLHRIVHVMVFDKTGRFGIQKRTAEESYKPLHWATAACGHPCCGETYETAGGREAQEEIGVKPTLHNFRKVLYEDPERPGLRRFLGIFETNCEPDDIHVDLNEVAAFQFVTRERLQQMVDAGELFHPELLYILTSLYGFSTKA